MSFVLHMFGTQIDLTDEVTPRYDDSDTESNTNNNSKNDNAKTREQLKDRQK
jgi:hypothetical protein